MLKIFLLISLFFITAAQTRRQEVASKAFNFLYKHCARDEFDPSQYAHPDCYSVHWTAKCLYRTTKTCPMPDSDFDRGGYIPYSPITYIEHQLLMFEISGVIDGKDYNK